MSKEPLMTLKTKADGRMEPAVAGAPDTAASGATGAAPAGRDSLPVLGLFAVGFGILGIFTFAPVFVPLALILGLIALFVGQVPWGLGAVGLAVIGIVTSPFFMTLMGIGAAWAWVSSFF